jgi:hypothetical protein
LTNLAPPARPEAGGVRISTHPMTASAFPSDLVRDVAKRRTFAIISHPEDSL